MLIKKIFNFLSNFHYNSIYNYSRNLKFNVFIDVGSHEGEFISRFLNEFALRVKRHFRIGRNFLVIIYIFEIKSINLHKVFPITFKICYLIHGINIKI